MKKTKIIIPALGMLLLSTAASVTGTVAWFSMNNFVNATEMNIQAKAEKGIVISNEAKAQWLETVTASHSGLFGESPNQTALEVLPTSTATGASWCHANSSNADQANTGNPYEMLNPTTDTTTGIGYVDDNGHTGFDRIAGDSGETPTPTSTWEADSQYFLKNSFYIKSSAGAITSNLYINKVSVVAPSTQASPALNRALRVLVVYSTNSYIFAPFADATLTYDVCTNVTLGDNPDTDEHETDYPINTIAHVTANGSTAQDIQISSSALEIPARTSEAPLQLDVYLYFEGEDAACKSTNLTASLDKLQVSVKFGTKTTSNS